MMSSTKPKKHPAINVALQLWAAYRWTLLWYWIVFIIVIVALHILLRDTGGEVDIEVNGIWAGSSASPKVFMLVFGLMITPVSLAGFVSNGVTRKHFSLGATLFIIGVTLLCTLIFAAGFPVEKAALDWFGHSDQLVHPPLFRTAAAQFLIIVGYFGMGWLIGTSFYRYNWRVGVIISVLSFVPVTIMEFFAGSAGFLKFLEGRIPIPALNFGIVFILLAVIAAAIVCANYLMLRKAPIKRKIF